MKGFHMKKQKLLRKNKKYQRNQKSGFKKPKFIKKIQKIQKNKVSRDYVDPGPCIWLETLFFFL